MENLFQFQQQLLHNTSTEFVRDALDELPWNSRFLAIQGLRGVGKTTLMLQYIKVRRTDSSKYLYVTMEHPYFFEHSLFDLAQTFTQFGGEMLFIDEVHKYPNWSREIKLIYDGFPHLQVVFSASSLLQIFSGDSDLSRRVLKKELPGLSFREYISYSQQIELPKYSLDVLLNNHQQIATEILNVIRPLPLFKSYVRNGYFPFSAVEHEGFFLQRLLQVIESTLIDDIAFLNGFDDNTVFKIKKLLAVISDSTPFTVNVSKVADKMGIARNTVKQYLFELQKGKIINYLMQENKGVSQLQKPDKLYLENTNFSYALSNQADVGAVRETYAVNQLRNAGYHIFLPKKGDLWVEQVDAIFEIGGKNKKNKQIEGLQNGYLLKDDIEIGFGNTIPLWLLGFLY